jgi:hypothetical protein
MIPAPPYGPALGSKIQKMQLQLRLQKKIINVVMHTVITWWYMKNMKSFFSENKTSTHNEKDLGDSSRQALINFSSSEYIF